MDGIRTVKTNGSTIHHYTLNGSQIVTETWTTKSSSGVETPNHFLVYLYDENGAPVGLQYRNKSDAKNVFYTYYFEKNLQGDIIAIYTENGTKIGSYTYDAWGNCTVSTESGTTTIQKQIVRTLNPFRYRGYYYDTETGLYYLQSRYYNPQWGRFLNADGYVSTGTGLLGYNMYAYCNNNPVMYCDCTGTCQHNGVAYGMGADCPSCMAGITKPEYDKIPVAQPSQTEDTNYEQYYIEKANESVLEPENSFSLAQNIINIPLNIFVTSLGLIPNTTWGVTAVGYVITTPIAITMHLANPNMSAGEKGIMVGYEIGVAGGGILLAYGLANWWNPTGWVAIAVPIGYTLVTFVAGSVLQSEFENN